MPQPVSIHDKAGNQKWFFLNKIISLSKINHSSIFFSFLAKFHSFVNAFQLIVMIFMPDSVELLEIIYFNTAKSNDIWTKNDNNTIPIIKHHNSKHYIYSILIVCVFFKKYRFITSWMLTKHFRPDLFHDSDLIRWFLMSTESK